MESGQQAKDEGGRLGPLLPPELVPALEQPARPKSANPLAVLGVVVAVVGVIALGAYGGWRWYAAAVLDISLAAVEAAASDDIAALKPLVLPDTAATPEFRRALAGSHLRADVRFAEPVREGTTVRVRFTYGSERGTFTLRPATDAFGEAVLTWTGPPFGAGTGRVALSGELDGWRVLYIAVGKRGVSFMPKDAKATFGNVGG